MSAVPSKQGSWDLLNHHEFSVRTGVMRDYLDFAALGISPSSPTGHFERAQLSELLTFCKENQEYHIISYKDHVYYNCSIGVGDFYFLGNGDKNPRLAYEPGPITVAEILEIAKFYMS